MAIDFVRYNVTGNYTVPVTTNMEMGGVDASFYQETFLGVKAGYCVDVTLPGCGAARDQRVTVKGEMGIEADATITVKDASGQTLKVLNTAYAGATFYTDGAAWFTL